MDEAAIVGAAAGAVAPILLAAVLFYCERVRLGHDPRYDAVSDLGDGVDRAALAFVFVNSAVGVLLGYFAALFVYHELRFTVAALMVGVAAVGSVVIGFTPCQHYCRRPGFNGRARGFVQPLHRLTALANATILAALPVVTVFDMPDSSRSFEVVVTVLAILTPFTVVAAAILGLVFKRREKRYATRAQPWREPPRRSYPYGLLELAVLVAGYAWIIAISLSGKSLGALCIAATAAWLVLASVGAVMPRPGMPRERFAVENSQQNTIYGLSNGQVGRFHLYRIDDPAAFRRFLSTAIDGSASEPPLIIGERRRDESSARSAPDFTCTIGFSHRGLAALGVDYGWNASFTEDAFRETMAARKDLLGDAQPAAPWRDPVDVVVWIYARSPAALDEAHRRLDEIRSGSVEVGSIATVRDPFDRQPFGFVDGISQPWVRQVPLPRSADTDRRARSSAGEAGSGLHTIDPRGGGKLFRRSEFAPSLPRTPVPCECTALSPTRGMLAMVRSAAPGRRRVEPNKRSSASTRTEPSSDVPSTGLIGSRST